MWKWLDSTGLRHLNNRVTLCNSIKNIYLASMMKISSLDILSPFNVQYPSGLEDNMACYYILLFVVIFLLF